MISRSAGTTRAAQHEPGLQDSSRLLFFVQERPRAMVPARVRRCVFKFGLLCLSGLVKRNPDLDLQKHGPTLKHPQTARPLVGLFRSLPCQLVKASSSTSCAAMPPSTRLTLYPPSTRLRSKQWKPPALPGVFQSAGHWCTVPGPHAWIPFS